MRTLLRRLGHVGLVALFAVAVYVFFAPGTAMAGKGGGKGGGNPPPACGCAEVYVLPDGTVCTLEACGSDCVYVCTLPAP